MIVLYSRERERRERRKREREKKVVYPSLSGSLAF